MKAIKLEWTPIAGAHHYEIMVVCGGERGHCTTYASVEPVFYYNLGVDPEPAYKFQVRAWDELGAGSWSEIRVATVPLKAPEWISVKMVDRD